MISVLIDVFLWRYGYSRAMEIGLLTATYLRGFNKIVEVVGPSSATDKTRNQPT